eukprot:gene34128-42080_t
MQTVLSKYALSPAVMRLWGYPIAIGAGIHVKNNDSDDLANIGKRSLDSLTSSELDEEFSSSKKKARVDDEQQQLESTSGTTVPQVDTTGLYTGSIPSEKEALHILSQLSSFKVASFDGTPYGPASGSSDSDLYRQTVSSRSPKYLTTQGDSQSAPLGIAAVDCEMCQSASGPVVTRVTVVDGDSCVVLDVLVRPSEPITEYRTQFSGITAEMLTGVTTTLQQVQVALLRLITTDTVLVGHSLENDLRCLRLCHSLCVDTAVIYPHPKGYPLRQKLKTLAADLLNLTIQKADSKRGHDSVEDARAALQLALLKAERGPMFGVKNTDAARVSLFSQFPENTSTFLSWEREASTAAPVSSVTNEGETVAVLPPVESASVTSESYLMESCIGGNATVSSSDTTSGAVETACQFIASQGQDDADKMALVYVGIKRPAGDSATRTSDIHTQISAIRSAVQGTTRHGLLMITGQNSSKAVTALRTKKRICLKNPMASAVWSRENEDQLQFEAGLNAMGGVVLSVI